MFEQYISGFLASFLGKYIQDTGDKALRVSLWNGELDLKNLELKTHAILPPEAPVLCHRGYVGKLRVSIPWTRLGSAPVQIEVEKLYLLLRPKKGAPWDEKAEKDLERERKNRALETFESLRTDGAGGDDLVSPDATGEGDTTTGSSDAGARDKSFLQRIQDGIANNVQITVNQVHVRYEDGDTHPLAAVAMGFVLDSLQCVSANADWKKGFVANTSGLLHKLLSLDGWSMYIAPCARDAMLVNNHPSASHCAAGGAGDSDLRAKLWGEFDALRTSPDVQKHRIIDETDVHLRLRLQQGRLNLKLPRVTSTLFISTLRFTVTRSQYERMLHLVDYLTNFEGVDKFRQFRPEVAVKASPRAWWRYGITCITTLIQDAKERRRLDWKKIREFKTRGRQYANLWKRSQGMEWLPALTPSEVVERDALHDALETHQLIWWRKVAYSELSVDAMQHQTQRQLVALQETKRQGWLQWATRGYMGAAVRADAAAGMGVAGAGAPPPPPAGADASQRTWTDDERTQLAALGLVDSVSNTADVQLPLDYVVTSTTVMIAAGEVQLLPEKLDDGVRAFAEFTLSDMRFAMDSMTEASKTVVSLGDLRIRDSAPAAGVYTTIARRAGTAAPNVPNTNTHTNGPAAAPKAASDNGVPPGAASTDLVTVVVEKCPLDQRAGFGVDVTVAPVHVVIHPTFATQIAAFLRPPATINLEIVPSMSDNLKQMAHQQLDAVVDAGSALDVRCKLEASTFVFPFSAIPDVIGGGVGGGTEQYACPSRGAMVVTLGSLDLKTDLARHRERAIALAAGVKLSDEHYYERFCVNLEAASASVAESGEAYTVWCAAGGGIGVTEGASNEAANTDSPPTDVPVVWEFVAPFNMGCTIERLLDPDANPQHPAMKVALALPHMHVNLSRQTLLLALETKDTLDTFVKRFNPQVPEVVTVLPSAIVTGLEQVIYEHAHVCDIVTNMAGTSQKSRAAATAAASAAEANITAGTEGAAASLTPSRHYDPAEAAVRSTSPLAASDILHSLSHPSYSPNAAKSEAAASASPVGIEVAGFPADKPSADGLVVLSRGRLLVYVPPGSPGGPTTPTGTRQLLLHQEINLKHAPFRVGCAGRVIAVVLPQAYGPAKRLDVRLSSAAQATSLYRALQKWAVDTHAAAVADPQKLAKLTQSDRTQTRLAFKLHALDVDLFNEFAAEAGATPPVASRVEPTRKRATHVRPPAAPFASLKFRGFHCVVAMRNFDQQVRLGLRAMEFVGAADGAVFASSSVPDILAVQTVPTTQSDRAKKAPPVGTTAPPPPATDDDAVELIHLECLMCTARSPFWRRDGPDILISVNASTLSLCLTPTFAAFGEMVFDLLGVNSLHEPSQTPEHSAAPLHLQPLTGRADPPASRVDVSLSAEMEALHVTCFEEIAPDVFREFLGLSMEKASFAVTTSDEQFAIKGNLGNLRSYELIADDPDPPQPGAVLPPGVATKDLMFTKRPLLGMVETSKGSLIKFEYRSPNGVGGGDTPFVSGYITAVMQQVHSAFHFTMLDRILLWTGSGHIVDRLKKVTQRQVRAQYHGDARLAAAAAPPPGDTGPPSVIQIDVQLVNPLVALPPRPDDQDHLLAALGDVRFRSMLTRSDEGTWTQSMQFDFADVGVDAVSYTPVDFAAAAADGGGGSTAPLPNVSLARRLKRTAWRMGTGLHVAIRMDSCLVSPASNEPLSSLKLSTKAIPLTVDEHGWGLFLQVVARNLLSSYKPAYVRPKVSASPKGPVGAVKSRTCADIGEICLSMVQQQHPHPGDDGDGPGSPFRPGSVDGDAREVAAVLRARGFAVSMMNYANGGGRTEFNLSSFSVTDCRGSPQPIVVFAPHEHAATTERPSVLTVKMHRVTGGADQDMAVAFGEPTLYLDPDALFLVQDLLVSPASADAVNHIVGDDPAEQGGTAAAAPPMPPANAAPQPKTKMQVDVAFVTVIGMDVYTAVGQGTAGDIVRERRELFTLRAVGAALRGALLPGGMDVSAELRDLTLDACVRGDVPTSAAGDTSTSQNQRLVRVVGLDDKTAASGRSLCEFNYRKGVEGLPSGYTSAVGARLYEMKALALPGFWARLGAWASSGPLPELSMLGTLKTERLAKRMVASADLTHFAVEWRGPHIEVPFVHGSGVTLTLGGLTLHNRVEDGAEHVAAALTHLRLHHRGSAIGLTGAAGDDEHAVLDDFDASATLTREIPTAVRGAGAPPQAQQGVTLSSDITRMTVRLSDKQLAMLQRLADVHGTAAQRVEAELKELRVYHPHAAASASARSPPSAPAAAPEEKLDTPMRAAVHFDGLSVILYSTVATAASADADAGAACGTPLSQFDMTHVVVTSAEDASVSVDVGDLIVRDLSGATPHGMAEVATTASQRCRAYPSFSMDTNANVPRSTSASNLTTPTRGVGGNSTFASTPPPAAAALDPDSPLQPPVHTRQATDPPCLSVRRDADSGVSLQFRGLHLLFIPPYVQRLMQFADAAAFVPAVEAAAGDATAAPVGASQRVGATTALAVAENAAVAEAPPAPPPTAAPRLRVHAGMDEFTLGVVDGTQLLCTISLDASRVGLEYDAVEDWYEVRGVLGSARVTDNVTVGGQYPHIVGPSRGSTARTSLRQAAGAQNTPESIVEFAASTRPVVDADGAVTAPLHPRVELTLRSLTFAIVPSFMMRVQGFAGSPALAALAAGREQQQQQQQGPKAAQRGGGGTDGKNDELKEALGVTLKLAVLNPILVVPEAEDRNASVIADLGQITLENELNVAAATEVVKLQLCNMALACRPDPQTVASIVQKVNINAAAIRCLKPRPPMPKLQLRAYLEETEAVIHQSHVELLLRVAMACSKLSAAAASGGVDAAAGGSTSIVLSPLPSGALVGAATTTATTISSFDETDGGGGPSFAGVAAGAAGAHAGQQGASAGDGWDPADHGVAAVHCQLTAPKISFVVKDVQKHTPRVAVRLKHVEASYLAIPAKDGGGRAEVGMTLRELELAEVWRSGAVNMCRDLSYPAATAAGGVGGAPNAPPQAQPGAAASTGAACGASRGPGAVDTAGDSGEVPPRPMPCVRMDVQTKEIAATRSTSVILDVNLPQFLFFAPLMVDVYQTFLLPYEKVLRDQATGAKGAAPPRETVIDNHFTLPDDLVLSPTNTWRISAAKYNAIDITSGGRPVVLRFKRDPSMTHVPLIKVDDGVTLRFIDIGLKVDGALEDYVTFGEGSYCCEVGCTEEQRVPAAAGVSGLGLYPASPGNSFAPRVIREDLHVRFDCSFGLGIAGGASRRCVMLSGHIRDGVYRSVSVLNDAPSTEASLTVRHVQAVHLPTPPPREVGTPRVPVPPATDVVHIVDPTTLSVTYRVEGDATCVAQAVVDPVTIRLCLGDIELLTYFAKSLDEAGQQRGADAAAHPSPSKTSAASAARAGHRGNSPDGDTHAVRPNASMNSVGSTGSFGGAGGFAAGQLASLTMPSLVIVFVDDSHGTPLPVIDIAVRDAFAKQKGDMDSGGRSVFTASAAIACRGYNADDCEWEPCVERFEVKASGETTPFESRGPSSEVPPLLSRVQVAMQRVQIAVTPHLLQSVARFQSTCGKIGVEPVRSQSLYTLRNDSGLPIAFYYDMSGVARRGSRRSGSAPSSAQDLTSLVGVEPPQPAAAATLTDRGALVLPPGAVYAFDTASAADTAYIVVAASASADATAALHTLTPPRAAAAAAGLSAPLLNGAVRESSFAGGIKAEGGDRASTGPWRPVPLGAVGRSLLQGDLVWEVAHADGSKVLSLRTSVCIENHLADGIRVDGVGVVPAASAGLPGRAVVPSARLRTPNAISVEPVSGGYEPAVLGYAFSSLASLKPEWRGYVVRCAGTPTPTATPPSDYCMVCHIIDRGGGDIVLELHPPMTIANRLPITMNYSVRCGPASSQGEIAACGARRDVPHMGNAWPQCSAYLAAGCFIHRGVQSTREALVWNGAPPLLTRAVEPAAGHGGSFALIEGDAGDAGVAHIGDGSEVSGFPGSPVADSTTISRLLRRDVEVSMSNPHDRLNVTALLAYTPRGGVVMYSPLWVINETEYPAQVFNKNSAVGISLPPTGPHGDVTPLPVHSIDGDGENFFFRFGDRSAESVQLRLSRLAAAGGSMVVPHPQATNEDLYRHVGLHVETVAWGDSTSATTRVLRLVPRWIVHNETDEELVCRIVLPTGTRPKMTIPAGASRSCCTSGSEKATTLELRYASDGSCNHRFGRAFELTPSVDMLLRLNFEPHHGYTPTKYCFTDPTAPDGSPESFRVVHVTTKEHQGSLHVVVTPCEKPPYRLENRTPYPMTFRQTDVYPHTVRSLPPRTSVAYAPDDPFAAVNVTFEVFQKDGGGRRAAASRSILLDRPTTAGERVQLADASLPPVHCRVRHCQRAARSVVAFGTDYYIHIKTGAAAAGGGGSGGGGGAGRGAAQHQRRLISITKLTLDGIGVGLSIPSKRLDVAYLSCEDITVVAKQQGSEQNCTVAVQSLQVDDESEECPLFPVVLRRDPEHAESEMNKRGRLRPIIALDVLRSNQSPDVLMLQDFRLHVSPLELQLTDRFLGRCLLFHETLEELDGCAAAGKGASGAAAIAAAFTERFCKAVSYRLDPDVLAGMAALGAAAYVGRLAIEPLHVTLSFARLETNPQSPFLRFCNRTWWLGYVLRTIERTSLEWGVVELSDKTLPLARVMQIISDKYMAGLQSQAPLLLFSTSLLGNPAATIRGVGKGVSGLYEGVVVTGGVQGVVEGVGSFFSSTGSGIAGSVATLTRSIARATSQFTYDPEWDRGNLHQTAHPHGGLRGTLDGVGGLIAAPVTGYREEGISGMTTGIARGAVGLLTKPVTGVLNEVSDLLDTRSQNRGERARPPRTFTERPKLRGLGMAAPAGAKEAEGSAAAAAVAPALSPHEIVQRWRNRGCPLPGDKALTALPPQTLARWTSWNEFKALHSPKEYYDVACHARDAYLATLPPAATLAPPHDASVDLARVRHLCNTFGAAQLAADPSLQVTTAELAAVTTWDEFRALLTPEEFYKHAKHARDSCRVPTVGFTLLSA